jgi:N-acetylmuramoyl-L-alanine amidase
MALNAVPAEKGLALKQVRFFSYPGFTRIVFEIESAAPYVLNKKADSRSVVLGAYDGPLTVAGTLPPVRDAVVAGLELNQEFGRSTIVIRLDRAAGNVRDFVLRNPDRIVLDVMRGADSAQPFPVTGKSTLIVLDPGHGGKDTGVISQQGQEKDRALEFAQGVRQALQKKAEEDADCRFVVVLTREKDQAFSLADRAAVAGSGAALFVSIHMSLDRDARVYILDPDDGPARPATDSGRNFLDFDASSARGETLWGSQQAQHTKESGDLGRLLAQRLHAPGGEPVQAGLALLKAVDTAAVMVEIGLGQDRAWVVNALADGIARYARENR